MYARTDSGPGRRFAAVSPSDTVNFGPASAPTFTRGLYIGATGDVVAVDEDGNAVTFKAVPAGTVLPIRCKRVNSTNTTATDIVRLWD